MFIFRLFARLIGKEGDHSHVHSGEIPCLMERNEDDVVSGRNLEISGFWRFENNREQDRPSAGGRDPKIRFTLTDEIDHVFCDPDVTGKGLVVWSGMHSMLNA
jgi:hypothetical protein